MLLFCTPYGPATYPDSAWYMMMAHNLMAGHGYTVSALGGWAPASHYPPLYPVVLAGLGSAGLALPSAALYLNVVMLALSVLIVGLMVRDWTGASSRIPILAALTFLISADTLFGYMLAQTEALFLALALAALYLTARYRGHRRRGVLIAAALAASLALLTRYVGLALVATCAAALLLDRAQALRRRIGDSLGFAAIAMLPSIGWAIHNRITTHTATNRRFVCHPIGLTQARQASDAISHWIVPNKTPDSARVVVTIVAIACAVMIILWSWRRTRLDSAAAGIRAILVLFAVCYSALLVVSISFADAGTPLDARIMLPLYACSIVLVFALSRDLWGVLRARRIRLAVALFGLSLMARSLARGVGWMRRSRLDGWGYASRAWREASGIKRIAGLPASVPVYSNAPDAVYIILGRETRRVPYNYNLYTLQPNTDRGAELAAMAEDLSRHDGVVVYFHAVTWRHYDMDADELRKALRLRIECDDANAQILRPDLRLPQHHQGD